MWLLIGLAGLTVISTAVVWVGADVLENAANRLSVYYGLPLIVQGAIVAAIGSSMPELMTAVLAPLVHADFELGVAAIIGSAIFNILVIPAIATLTTPGGLTATRDLVYKEAQFYLVAVSVFLLVLSLAVIYAPTDAPGITGEITPWLAVGPLALYGLYGFLQYLDTVEHVPRRDPTGIHPAREWALLIGGFLLILAGVEGLLRAAIGFGDALGTPSFLWGLTIVAAATSLPDAFVSVRAAERDRSVISIANVFGSNVFDLLVAVPAGVIVVGGTLINFDRIAPLAVVLIIATVVLFTALRTDFKLTRREAWLLLVTYLVFLLWVVLEGITQISIG